MLTKDSTNYYSDILLLVFAAWLNNESFQDHCTPPVSGGVSASERRCIDTFIRHGIRTEFRDENMAAMSDLVEDADDVLSEQAMRDKHQLFLNHKTELKYDLRQRRNEFTLTQKSKIRYLADCKSK